MNRYYLAVDIGASSGRHILGWMENGKMNLREIYRFSNGMERVDGTLCWNLVGLFEEIKAGMRECKKLGINPESMGIDTWAVDFVPVSYTHLVLPEAENTWRCYSLRSLLPVMKAGRDRQLFWPFPLSVN